jgi:cell wall-associated NlpC family hydrolase
MSRKFGLNIVRGIIAFALAFQVIALHTATASVAPTTVVAAAQTKAAAPYKRHVAMRFALSKAGGWYSYGGNGPSSYDCSGLTAAAYAKVKIYLPRVAGNQRSSGMTASVSLSHARWGDLVFWGTGHVEFFSSRQYRNGKLIGFKSFGAHHSGTRISYRMNLLTSSYTQRASFRYVLGAGPR